MLARLFHIDVRSLAALRIGMTLILLFDLIVYRWPFANIFLTDDGIITREMAYQFIGPGHWTFYVFDGSLTAAQILLTVHIAATICLMIGFKTKTATLICLVLTWSLQMRDPLVLSGGDVLMRMMLVWSVFLPLGAVWSVDSMTRHVRQPASYTERSVATAAIMIQVALMYFFAGLAKCNSFWFSGQATELALQLEMYRRPFAESLLAFPWILRANTWMVLVAELAVPWLLFSPWHTIRIRTAGLIGFWLLHLGIWATISIGFFSAIAMTCWLVFVPSQFWDRVCGRPQGFDQTRPRDFAGLRKLSQYVCGAALAFCVAINISFLQDDKDGWYANGGELFAKATMLVQEFEMWGQPPTANPHFRYTAQTDTRQVDLLAWYLHESTEKPDSEYHYMHSQAWRRLHWELINESELHRQLRARLLRYLVRHWDATSADPVRQATFQFYLTPLGDDPNPPVTWAHYP